MKHGYTILNLNLKGDQWNGVTNIHQGPKSSRPKSLLAKLLTIVFLDSQGVVLVDFLPKGETINSEVYIETLRKLKAKI